VIDIRGWSGERFLQVECIFFVSHSKQGEYQEDRKKNPEDVTNNDDQAIPDNVEVKLVEITHFPNCKENTTCAAASSQAVACERVLH
jgi:hypothetical protein